MERFSVYCLKYADSFMRESMAFSIGDALKSIPITFTFYLIKAQNRNILIDVGCDSMPDFEMKRFYSPPFVLRQADISADEVTDVILTHAHHDHIEAVKYYKNATLYINQAEYPAAKPYFSEEMRVITFENELILTPQIRVLKWGGHSCGSCIVEVACKDGLHILCGDECYTNECISKGIPTGASFDPAKSLEFIKKYSSCTVHTCHDPSLDTALVFSHD